MLLKQHAAAGCSVQASLHALHHRREHWRQLTPSASQKLMHCCRSLHPHCIWAEGLHQSCCAWLTAAVKNNQFLFIRKSCSSQIVVHQRLFCGYKPSLCAALSLRANVSSTASVILCIYAYTSLLGLLSDSVKTNVHFTKGTERLLLTPIIPDNHKCIKTCARLSFVLQICFKNMTEMRWDEIRTLDWNNEKH